MEIHSTALIDPSARIGTDCVIGPYTIVEAEVVIGAGSRLDGHVVIRRGTHLGEGVHVESFVVIGGEPQSLGFDASIESRVVIGNNVRLREGCVIHRSTQVGGETIIGDDCYLMSQTHVAHDCILGTGVIMASGALLGGHVVLGSRCFIGGGTGVHQFCRIGSYAIVGSLSMITVDVAPCLMVTQRNEVNGLNKVGLKRASFDRESIKDLKACYQGLFSRGDANLKRRAAEMLQEGACGSSELGEQFLKFFENGKRGFARPRND